MQTVPYSLSLPFVYFFLQMYIALISAHALGLSGMHFFTCIKAQWNGKNFLSCSTEYSTMTNIQQTECQRDKVMSQFTAIYTKESKMLKRYREKLWEN